MLNWTAKRISQKGHSNGFSCWWVRSCTTKIVAVVVVVYSLTIVTIGPGVVEEILAFGNRQVLRTGEFESLLWSGYPVWLGIRQISVSSGEN